MGSNPTRVTKVMEDFTKKFNEGYTRLGWDDAKAAEVLDTSIPTISRWRRGIVVPAVATMVLGFIEEEMAKEESNA